MLCLLSNLFYFSFVAFFWTYYFCLSLVWLSYFRFENAYSYYILVVPRKQHELLAYHTIVLISEFYCSLDNAKTSEHFYSIYSPPYLNVVSPVCVFVFSIPQYVINIVLCNQCSLRTMHVSTIFLVLYLFLHAQLSFWEHVPSACKTSSFRAACLLANSFHFGLSENSMSHSILKCQWGGKWHLS